MSQCRKIKVEEEKEENAEDEVGRQREGPIGADHN